MRRFFLAAFFLALLPTASMAEMKYYPDPVYKKLAPEDSFPMEEVMNLAAAGDARAEFIVGDLYAKEKGGLSKDPAKAGEWFEKAALHGNNQAFLRLAALAKRADKPIEAWQWYTLALASRLSADTEKFAVRARNELIEKSELTSEDLREGRAGVNEWREKRSEAIRAERAAAADAMPEITPHSEAQHFTGTPNRGAYNE